MEKINGYWVDSNNNKWDCDYYTKKEAENCSMSLKDCTDCTDCRNCTYCTHCTYCRYCIRCTYCTHCTYCRYCIRCTYCADCSSCTDCTNCRYCKYFYTNPQRYTTPEVGSRNANTTIYWVDTDIQVVCGCFRGNLIEWENKIKVTYAIDEKHYIDYMKQVEIVKTLIKMNGKVEL